MSSVPSVGVVVDFTGLFVGWLFFTYGLLLWGLGDSILGINAGARGYSLAYPFGFVTTGVALMLLANGAFVTTPIRVGILQLLGYTVLGAVGTIIFTLRLIYLDLAGQDGEANGPPHGGGT